MPQVSRAVGSCALAPCRRGAYATALRAEGIGIVQGERAGKRPDGRNAQKRVITVLPLALAGADIAMRKPVLHIANKD